MFNVNEKLDLLELISKEIRGLKKSNKSKRKIERLEEIRHKIAFTKAIDENDLISL